MNLLRNVLMMGLVVQGLGAVTASAQHPNEPSADITQPVADSTVRSLSDSARNSTFGPGEFLKDQFIFGGTLGTPGFINLVAGKYFGRLGLRVAAGLPFFALGWTPNLGWEGDISYVFARCFGALAELFLFETRFDDPAIGRTFWGAGIGIAINFRGFFAEGGLSLWNHPGYSNSYPIQIGYIH